MVDFSYWPPDCLSRVIKIVIRLVFLLPIEQFSTECRKTKTNAITPANHNATKQRNEPIRIKSNVASVKLGETMCMQVLTLLIGRDNGASLSD